ncbi:MAG: hypothetical protein LLH30_15550 [Candidatus Manganitrophus sp. SA1]|nr:hypothetical protein [Candidatus Manganitrophus morganii]
MSVRLLDPNLLPPTLWDSSSGTLILPPALAQAYQTVIDRHGLRELAESRDQKDPPCGGPEKERTDKHLAQAFDGSVARTQLALLDPNNDIPFVSNSFISCLAGNSVNLTDAPCGAGASAFSFLANIAELRSQNVLPREPLDVALVGAELSDSARSYAEEILSELRPSLETQAIFITAEFREWDVTNSLSNTDLIQRVTVTSSKCCRRLLIVANFNGYLEKERKRKESVRQIEELFRHASGKNSMAIWIEPNMNRATSSGGTLPWLRDLFKKQWRRFARENSGGDDQKPISTSSSQFQLPLNPNTSARVNLAVMSVDLGRAK